jgi:hypothetical protein
MKHLEQQQLEYNQWRSSCKARGYYWKVDRTDIINYLIKKYNYVKYLEIGVNTGENIRKINIFHKDGVDPGIECGNPVEVNYPVTSNEFFDSIRGHDIKYDIIFIDGLHHDYQVYKDIKDSLNHLQPNGTIVCHDMNPLWEMVQNKTGRFAGCWNGDCWKAWVALRSELNNYCMEVIDTDHGVGIIRPGAQQLITLPCKMDELEFEYLDINRKELLNLITIEEFYAKYD